MKKTNSNHCFFQSYIDPIRSGMPFDWVNSCKSKFKSKDHCVGPSRMFCVPLSQSYKYQTLFDKAPCFSHNFYMAFLLLLLPFVQFQPTVQSPTQHGLSLWFFTKPSSLTQSTCSRHQEKVNKVIHISVMAHNIIHQELC